MKTPLLFDLDGTITDPKPGFLASVNFALETLGEPLREEAELIQFIGPPLRGTFGVLLDTDDKERIEKAVALYRQRLSDGGMFEAAVYSGMKELLDELANEGSYQLFVATGKPRTVAGEIIEHFGLAPFFEKVYGAELDGRFVDKAELVAHIWKTHELEPKRGVMIGDTAFDIRAGRLNDLKTIGVSWGYGTNAQLEAEGANAIVGSVDELRRLIES